MTQLSDKVYEKLCCIYCKAIISCPPVRTLQNGESICGRCTLRELDKNTSVRNSAYENLSQEILFPCKNKHLGCRKWLFMKDVIEHEQNCKFSGKAVLFG